MPRHAAVFVREEVDDDLLTPPASATHRTCRVDSVLFSFFFQGRDSPLFLLSREAASIDVASDGEEAIEKLAAGRYDIVILDLMLPRKNGLIVAEAVAAMADGPRLIVLSAISRYLGDRFPPGTPVLQKPFEIDKLAETVRGIRRETA